MTLNQSGLKTEAGQRGAKIRAILHHDLDHVVLNDRRP